MVLKFNAKSYHCEYVKFSADEEGTVVVTLSGNFPPPEQMTLEEVSAIVNDPLFAELFRLGWENAEVGTPLFHAFNLAKRRMDRGENPTAVIRFERSGLAVAA